MSVTMPEHMIKDGRAAYLTLQVFSAYSAITLLGASDADLFGSSRQIALPIFNASISTVAFLWVSPSIIFSFILFLHMLAVNMRCSLPHDTYDVDAREVAFGTPIYLRWAFCLSESSRALQRQYWTSLAVAYSLPIASLAYLWWRTHVIHSFAVSSFLAVSLVSLAIVHLTARVHILPQVGAREGALLAAIIFGALGMGWTTYSRTVNIDSELFAKATLSRGSLIERPKDYVPRFVWVEKFLTEAGLEHARDPMRTKIENLWFDTRQYMLLTGAPHNLDSVDLRQAQMNHTFLPHVFIRYAHLQRSILTRADMESIDATGTNFQGANLAGAHLEQAYLPNAIFVDAQMHEVGLEEAFLSCSDFENALLRDAALDGTFLDRTSFRDAKMSGASLRGAYAKRADFRGADLSHVDLTGAILWGSNLSTTSGLTQKQLDGAIGDKETLLPYGLTVPFCAPEVPVQPLPYRRQWWLSIDWIKDRIECPGTISIQLSASAICRR